MKTNELYGVICTISPTRIIDDTIFQDYETALLFSSSKPDTEAVSVSEAIEKIRANIWQTSEA